MLRFLLLMTLAKVSSITQWIKQVRSTPFWAILAGFVPGDIPGVGTCYDFMRRLIDGPYHKPCPHIVRRSQNNTGRHKRNIKSEKEAKKAAQKDDQNPHQSQSEKLVQELLPQAEQTRVDDFRKILEDLLIRVGVMPSIEQGLITEPEHIIVSGDGSILESGASPHGKPTCSCRSEGIYNCQHDRIYSSPTATWCYNAHRECFVFGDRYYLMIIHQNGHDFPLLTVMFGGNESDYTLSLKAFDRTLKAIRENGLKVHIDLFCGDGHHDSYAHYEYFAAKQVIPLIPLAEKSKKITPHLPETQHLPQTPETPHAPETPATPQIPHLPEISHLHEAPHETHPASPAKTRPASSTKAQAASSAKADPASSAKADTHLDSPAKAHSASSAKAQAASSAKAHPGSSAKADPASSAKADTHLASPAEAHPASPARDHPAPPVRACPDSPVRLDTDGTPLCPAGMKMRHHGYNKREKTHIYACPVKRGTRRNGKFIYITHLDECPRKQDCAPDSSLGPLVPIKSDTDPRLYPPILRDSKKFKDLMNHRTSTERCNYLNDTYHLDRSCRNADYGLVRLCLANIVEHAVIRYLEALKHSSEAELFNQTLRELLPTPLLKAA
jgi:hypothetical protein